MFIAKQGDLFYVYKSGRIWQNDRVFCFFVDSDKAHWSQKVWQGAGFETQERAVEVLTELRRRETERRKAVKCS